MYWIVQNSWGIGWGMAGFAKVIYGENICGLGDDLISPTEVWDASIDKVRPFQLHLHPLESESRCLDGSPAGVYFSPGNGLNGGSKKTVVYFEGGGWCSPSLILPSHDPRVGVSQYTGIVCDAAVTTHLTWHIDGASQKKPENMYAEQ